MNRLGLKKELLFDFLGGWLMLNLAFLAAVSLRFDDLKVENPTYYNYYLQLWVFNNLLWLVLRQLNRGSSLLQWKEGVRKKMGKSLALILWHILLFALLLLALKETFFSRLFGAYFYILWTFFLLVWDGLYFKWQEKRREKGLGRRRIGLVGSGGSFNRLKNPEADLYHEGLKLVWSKEYVGKDALKPENYIQELEKADVQELYLALSDAQELLKWQRFADAHLMRTRIVPDFQMPFNKSFEVEYLMGVPLIYPRQEPLEDFKNRWLKRLLDLLLSFLVLVCILPIAFVFIAPLILISSKGPVFFRQLRSGINDEQFFILKFRSIGLDGKAFAIGNFIRRHSLDELPQFFNVLRGEMSIIGPRPHMLEHTDEYRSKLDGFMVRHLIKPGITGLAQVQGHRGSINAQEDLEARVLADVYYLENWSVLLDLKIVFLTVFQSLFPLPKAR